MSVHGERLAFEKNGIQIFHSDAFELLPQLKENSVHMILTDPPYFLEKLGKDWDSQRIIHDRTAGQRVKNLPAGMRFSPKQSLQFGAFFSAFAREAFRVLMPGGFFLSFSQGRLYQRMAVVSEDVGFWIRDMLAWHYTKKVQTKAFRLLHFVKKSKKFTAKEKDRLLKILENRRTPQLTAAFEPIMLAQKPLEGNFIHNFAKWGVGLIAGDERVDDKFPTTVFSVEKPDSKERTDHPTQKPGALLEQLIRIFSQTGHTILDPFIGSGSTAIAAIRSKRCCIGIEKDSNYISCIKSRIHKEFLDIF